MFIEPLRLTIVRVAAAFAGMVMFPSIVIAESATSVRSPVIAILVPNCRTIVAPSVVPDVSVALRTTFAPPAAGVGSPAIEQESAGAVGVAGGAVGPDWHPASTTHANSQLIGTADTHLFSLKKEFTTIELLTRTDLEGKPFEPNPTDNQPIVGVLPQGPGSTPSRPGPP